MNREDIKKKIERIERLLSSKLRFTRVYRRKLNRDINYYKGRLQEIEDYEASWGDDPMGRWHGRNY